MTIGVLRKIVLKFFYVITPLSVCGAVTKGAIVPLYLSISVISLFFILYTSIRLELTQKKLLLLFFLPISISLIGVCINMIVIDSIAYYDYVQQDLLGRLLNIFCYLSIVVFAFNTINSLSVRDSKRITKTYLWSIVIIFVPFGIWQLLNMFTGIWIPNIETRADLHSLTSYYSGIKRLTSFASEPSFLVPFLIDGIIIALYFRKILVIIALVILLLFSLSLGGYVNVLIISIAVVYYFSFRFNFKKGLWIGSLVIGSFLVLFFDEIFFLLDIVLNRQELAGGGIDIMQSSRLQMVVLPWRFVVQGGIIPLLFGFGPGSFKYLHLTEKLANGDFFHTTSNCLYTDLFYEGGVLALVSIILFFILMFYFFNKVQNGINVNEVICGKLLILQLLITSSYRADFMSMRFWGILVLILIFYRIASYKPNGDLSCNTKL